MTAVSSLAAALHSKELCQRVPASHNLCTTWNTPTGQSGCSQRRSNKLTAMSGQPQDTNTAATNSNKPPTGVDSPADFPAHVFVVAVLILTAIIVVVPLSSTCRSSTNNQQQASSGNCYSLP